ncbi:MAG TPA: hypothetical protein PK595_06030 [Bacteroidota bacterium]|nr:hypothetical protein [Bacteroidota bacterium]
MKLSLKSRLASVLSVLAVFVFVSCVDVDNPNVSTVDLRTLTKFVYLSSGSDNLQISVDGSVAATLPAAGESEFLSLPAGNRKLKFQYNGNASVDTPTVSFPQDVKGMFICNYEPGSGMTKLDYQFIRSHTTYDGNVQYVPDKALVRFVNYSDVNAKMQLVAGAVTKSTGTVQYGNASAYDTVSVAPQYTIVDATTNSTLAQGTVGTSQGRYTVVLFGSGSSKAAKVIKED